MYHSIHLSTAQPDGSMPPPAAAGTSNSSSVDAAVQRALQLLSERGAFLQQLHQDSEALNPSRLPGLLAQLAQAELHEKDCCDEVWRLIRADEAAPITPKTARQLVSLLASSSTHPDVSTSAAGLLNVLAWHNSQRRAALARCAAATLWDAVPSLLTNAAATRTAELCGALESLAYEVPLPDRVVALIAAAVTAYCSSTTSTTSPADPADCGLPFCTDIAGQQVRTTRALAAALIKNCAMATRLADHPRFLSTLAEALAAGRVECRGRGVAALLLAIAEALSATPGAARRSSGAGAGLVQRGGAMRVAAALEGAPGALAAIGRGMVREGDPHAHIALQLASVLWEEGRCPGLAKVPEVFPAIRKLLDASSDEEKLRTATAAIIALPQLGPWAVKPALRQQGLVEGMMAILARADGKAGAADALAGHGVNALIRMVLEYAPMSARSLVTGVDQGAAESVVAALLASPKALRGAALLMMRKLPAEKQCERSHEDAGACCFECETSSLAYLMRVIGMGVTEGAARRQQLGALADEGTGLLKGLAYVIKECVRTRRLGAAGDFCVGLFGLLKPPADITLAISAARAGLQPSVQAYADTQNMQSPYSQYLFNLLMSLEMGQDIGGVALGGGGAGASSSSRNGGAAAGGRSSSGRSGSGGGAVGSGSSNGGNGSTAGGGSSSSGGIGGSQGGKKAAGGASLQRGFLSRSSSATNGTTASAVQMKAAGAGGEQQQQQKSTGGRQAGQKKSTESAAAAGIASSSSPAAAAVMGAAAAASSAPADIKVCAQCGALPAAGQKLLWCAGCRSVR